MKQWSYLVAGLALVLLALLGGCATSVEVGCTAELNGLNVDEAKEILKPKWTKVDDMEKYGGPKPHVVYYSSEFTNKEGTKYGDYPACVCALNDNDQVNDCEVAKNSEEYTRIYKERFCKENCG